MATVTVTGRGPSPDAGEVRVNKLPFKLPLSFKFNNLVPSMGMVIIMINANGACRGT